MAEWELLYAERPWTLNGERSLHYHVRAKLVKEWREAFAWLALESHVPKLSAITVECTPILSGRGRKQDVGACFPAVKAAIDGLVDAGVIPDDDATYVKALTFKAWEPGPNAMRVIVRAVS